MISTKRFSGKQPASLVHGTRALRQIAVKKELLDAAADPLPSAPLRKEEGSLARWKKLNPKLEAPGRLKTNKTKVLLEHDVKPEVDDNESNQATEKKRRGKDGKIKGKSAKEKRKGKDGKKKRRAKEEEAKPGGDQVRRSGRLGRRGRRGQARCWSAEIYSQDRC